MVLSTSRYAYFFYDFITPAALIFFKKYAQIIVKQRF